MHRTLETKQKPSVSFLYFLVHLPSSFVVVLFKNTAIHRGSGALAAVFLCTADVVLIPHGGWRTGSAFETKIVEEESKQEVVNPALTEVTSD